MDAMRHGRRFMEQTERILDDDGDQACMCVLCGVSPGATRYRV